MRPLIWSKADLKYIKSVMKAELYAFYCWMKNNRMLAFMMLVWPYLMAGFLLGLGLLLGSLKVYGERMGVANPVFYIIASSGVLISSINIIDTAVATVLEHRWVGTLPYVVSSPSGFRILAMFGPLLPAIISSFISISAILPAAVLFEGILGVLKVFLALILIYIATLPLIGLAVIIAGITLIMREETNIASFMTPFMILVSGVYYPQTILPHVLQLLAKAVPVYYVVTAVKILATYHIPPFNIFFTIAGILFGLTLIYNTMVYPGVKTIENRIRSKGIQD